MSSYRRAWWLAGAAFLLVGLLGPAGAAADNGPWSDDGPVGEPLLLRNDNPLYLTLFSTAIPDRARAVAPHHWAWDLGYADANSIDDQNNPEVTDRVIVDAEVQRLELRVKYGLADHWEVAASLPYLWMGGGYLDPAISSVEKTLGLMPRARRIRGHDEFRYLVRLSGQNVVDETDTMRHGFADIPLQLKYQFRDQPDGWFPQAAVRGLLKLPTATDPLLGNRRVDGGIGLLAEQPIGSRVRLLINADVTTAHLPTPMKAVDLYPVMVSGIFAIEHAITRRATWEVQYAVSSNPYPKFHEFMTALNSEPMGIGLGWTYRLRPHTRLTLMAGENINSGWFDFSLSAGLKGEL